MARGHPSFYCGKPSKAMPPVSVVVTCYNEEEYVGEAIRSVVQQTRYDAICEIIVVDDGSEDNSEKVIREWEDRCSKVHYVYQENQGLPVARNTGIELSSGDFIALQDGDDIWLETRLEHQLDFVHEHPDVGLLYGDVYSFGDEEGKKRGYCTQYKYEDDDVLHQLFAYDAPILPSTVLINRACFDSVELFDPDLHLGQDTDLWLRIAGEYPIHHVGEPLVLKRQHTDSLGTDIEVKARYLLQVADKIADLYPEIEDLREKRKAKIYSGVARNFSVSGERGKAVKAVLSALRFDPYVFKHHATLVFVLLPVTSSQLQWVRRRVQGLKRLMGEIMEQTVES